MAVNLPSLLFGLGIAYIIFIFLRNQLEKLRRPLPPGPKGLPLVGNLRDLPKPGEFEAHHWLKHKEKYGRISSVSVLRQSIIIVNDAELARELLERRSAKYSSRPKQIFITEIVGWGKLLGMSPYNKRFRIMRKTLSPVIGSNAALAQFSDLQAAQVGHFLLHTLRDSENFLGHIRKAVGEFILKITYGYTAEPHRDDVLITMNGKAAEQFGSAAVPGAFMVDLFPFLRKVPDWVPGTGWKKTARQWSAELKAVADIPYQFVRRQVAQGRHETSFMSRLIEAGGSDPETAGVVATFYLAMTIYPEAQERGQEEIDRIIGKDRLPTLADRENLPYIDAIVKETFRWNPLVPMGLPHESTEDDVCEGYSIPKGSMVFANIWHFTHDPDVYAEPEAFKPERFLAGDGREPEPSPHRFVFGFGRRICPGRLLADNSLFLFVAQSLAVFRMSKGSEADGTEAEVKPRFQARVLSPPLPFNSIVKPRSRHHEILINSLEDIYPWQESDAKELTDIARLD
ncbi:putative cytochrome P450 oxidoreductase [Rosellinia necatrix]|uniref:Putative cytochrome P450 oxidoreductase n=1 Tax=Rosellinia necatrix TaxID=77044 RepID=A0A1W2TVF6_ROSNE|nr:putative cytochrome P450 oxidoreductase [Rosellinia necatrix]